MGALTLRAYTNWMQNFGDDYLFKQRIYLGTLSNTKWLVTSGASINKLGLQDQVLVDIKLNHTDKFSRRWRLKNAGKTL
ncbi:hypothetical protein [Mucilaginibacter antarcticus]|uniref:hypothetical protein n=1 Tax=Mucilaginibacter antarcticus TaxID=1855725 RepID=UPI00362550C4